MGLKMPEAFYKVENEKITVDEARERGIKKDLQCISKCCRVELSYVGPYKRKYSDKVVIVRDYFKLASNKQHDENCKFNTEGQVKIIARNSDGILTSINNKEYNFRLNLLASSLNKIKQNRQLDNNTILDEAINSGQKNKTYENQGKLDSYLSTMNKIMKLRSEIEENKELSGLVKLEFGDQSINWNKFYYSTEEYIKCFNYLNRNKINHPICIEGKIGEIKKPSASYPYYSIELKKPWIEEADPDGFIRIPSVSITVFNESIAKDIMSKMEEGNEYIAFYSFIKVNSNSYGERTKFLNIRGSIYHRKQVHVFSI
ncbi:hypothetical protein ACE38V_11495 [Cytobacillus sp. Hz8]|uniref:hypothetical protein n=1 Tax=Cytobacillus sp. Hz8 TaxID=3347168 RepID=UPI0035DD8A26